MEITSDFLLSALLQHNYLPNQNRQQEELPPILTSNSLSESVARSLAALPSRSSPPSGYDSISYSLTRFNHVPRLLSIPHPKPYSELVLRIVDNWEALSHITGNTNSILHLSEHPDGRVFVMNYPGMLEQGQQEIELSIGKHFLARTDIANFYPSIYSHAVPWALVGHDTAKSNRGPNFWFNHIDTSLRALRKGETHGIPVGPATSNIIADIILYRVDEELSKNYTFRRFNDDYIAFCSTESKAAEFVLDLSSELEKYDLHLNSGKTHIETLPRPIDAPWKTTLLAAKPKTDRIRSFEATRYLSLSVDISRKHPEASAIKYALKSLSPSTLDEEACKAVLIYGLNLAVYQPVLLPAIARLMDDERSDVASQGDILRQVLAANLSARHADGVSWLIYAFLKHKIGIGQELAAKVIDSGGCIPILLLYGLEDQAVRDSVVGFVTRINSGDPYERDRYWMLLYQLFLDNQVKPHQQDADVFEVMRGHGVSFVESAADDEAWRS